MKTILILFFLSITTELQAQTTPEPSPVKPITESPAITRQKATLYIIDGNPVTSAANPIPMPASVPMLTDNKYLASCTKKREEWSEILTTDLCDFLTIVPGVYQSQRGNDLHILGARLGGNLYVIDHMQVMQR